MTSLNIPDGANKVANDLLEAHGKSLSSQEYSFLKNVGQWPHTWGDCVSALLMQRSLDKHARALNKAASASGRHAKSLVWATCMLAIVAGVQLFK